MWQIVAKNTHRGRKTRFPERVLNIPAAGRQEAIDSARRILNAEGDRGYAITSVKPL